jgi:hypothetical protein
MPAGSPAAFAPDFLRGSLMPRFLRGAVAGRLAGSAGRNQISFRLLVFAVLAARAFSAEEKNADPLELLANDSPFRAPASAPAAPQNSTLQLRGIFQAGDGHWLSLLDPATQRAHWIRVGQQAGGIKVLKYDAERRLAVVERAGRTEQLVWAEPRPGKRG